jgi:ribonucleoside-diphosphate reductase alpha chain
MGAVQPFISGAISKTVNMPESATVEEIEEVYAQGWRLGLKALAVYRDNCKVGQPLTAQGKKTAAADTPAPAAAPAPLEHRPVRKRLPKVRDSKTVSFSVGGAEGYMTAASYPDGGLGEIFLKMSKQGSTLAGMMDAFSIAISIGLQYGVPLDTFVQKFTNMRFEPAGMTDDPDVRMSASIMDYIFRRLALDYLPEEDRAALGIYTAEERARHLETGSYFRSDDEDDLDVEALAQSAPIEVMDSSVGGASATWDEPKAHIGSSTELLEVQQGRTADAPLCFTCGTKMRPAGSCYVCEGCGSTSGCS